MSSRYGRQKKRKALRQIENLEQRDLLLRRQNKYLDEAVKYCAKVMGNNFIGLPVETTSTPLSGDFLRIHSNSLEPTIGSMSSIDAAKHLSRKVYEIGAITANVREDRYGDSIHFYAGHPEIGTATYCITREAMSRLPKEMLIRNISRAIATEFSVELERIKS